MMRKHLFTLILVVFTASSLSAKITLPALFSNNMVLQQKSNVAIWGSSNKHNILIKTSWDNKAYKCTTGRDGSWRLYVKTPSAGGTYKITLNDGSITVLNNVLIGEVWICSGQSNMEMPVKGFQSTPVLNSDEVLLNSENPEIRLYRLGRKIAASPRKDYPADWQQSDAESVKEFSAVGYQFAQLLQKTLKVPVGIIETTWGGTKIEAWMSAKSLSAFPQFKMPADTLKINQNTPTAIYNAMIAPLIGFNTKGVIWYQGESSCDLYKIYDQLMAAMVADWRKSWNQDMGFYYVQIAPYNYKDRFKPVNWYKSVPFLREAQQKALSEIPGSAMIGTQDLGAEYTIHPPDKYTVSKRLAIAALAKEYGKKGLSYLSPSFKSYTVSDTSAIIDFNNLDMGLITYNNSPLSGFEAAGSDHVFYPGAARLKGNKVEVKCNQVAHIQSVRYCFKDYETGNVYTAAGLPLLPFRTDNWELE